MDILKKHPPGRSDEYLDYIRTLPCYICSRYPAEPHHAETGGVSLKGSDFSCVPLCRHHHRELHDVLGAHSFQKAHDISIWHGVARAFITWADRKWSDNKEGD